MKRFCLLCCILQGWFWTSCNNQSPDSKETGLPYIIDFEQCISNARNIKISDIADTIELVELKTPEELPVSAIWQFISVGNYWFINAREGIFKFTDRGEYITKIGNHGQGPGEYTHLFDIAIDEDRKEVLLNTYKQLLYYDWDGNYLRMEKKGPIMINAAFSDSILWGTEYGDFIDKYILYGLNSQRDTIYSIPNPYYGIKPQDDGMGYVVYEKGKAFYHYQDDTFLKGPMNNDTIYRLKGSQCTPYVAFNMGKYKQPIEYMAGYNYEAFKKHGSNYWGIPVMSESERYFFIKAQRLARSEDAGRYIMYDKQERKGFLVNEQKNRTITDDILGGPDIWPIWTTDDSFVSVIGSYSYTKEIKEGNYTLSPELQKVVDSWNHDTNVILMFCRKKK